MWKDIIKNGKPDYLDFDGDGDTEEPMVDALKTVEQVESAKKEKIIKEDFWRHVDGLMDISELKRMLKEFGRHYSIKERTHIMNRIQELEGGGN